jgi:hypothetical protein
VNSNTGNSSTGNSSTGNSSTGNSSTWNFIPHLIDGQEIESVSGARFASVDPWTREPYRFADLIIANGDALGLADTTDMGKPISESRGNASN